MYGGSAVETTQDETAERTPANLAQTPRGYVTK